MITLLIYAVKNMLNRLLLAKAVNRTKPLPSHIALSLYRLVSTPRDKLMNHWKMDGYV